MVGELVDVEILDAKNLTLFAAKKVLSAGILAGVEGPGQA
jgi:hypothetical protein